METLSDGVCFKNFIKIFRRQYIYGVNGLFVPIFLGHFYFDPYISILPPLVLNLINVCYFSPFCHSTNRKS